MVRLYSEQELRSRIAARADSIAESLIGRLRDDGWFGPLPKGPQYFDSHWESDGSITVTARQELRDYFGGLMLTYMLEHTNALMVAMFDEEADS